MRSLYQVRLQEIHKLESILSKLPALEHSSRELAKAADAVFEPLAAQVGIVAAHDDPHFRTLQHPQFAV